MNKIVLILSVLLLVNQSGQAMVKDQPPLTQEMRDADLTDFPSKEDQNRQNYLIACDSYDKRLAEAKKRFEAIQCPWDFGSVESMKDDYITPKIFKEEAVLALWRLSQDFDYGPANKMLVSLFIHLDFDVYSDWSAFFRCRPQSEYDMNLYREGLYDAIEYEKQQAEESQQAEEEVAARQKALSEGSNSGQFPSSRSSGSSAGSTLSTLVKEGHEPLLGDEKKTLWESFIAVLGGGGEVKQKTV